MKKDELDFEVKKRVRAGSNNGVKKEIKKPKEVSVS